VLGHRRAALGFALVELLLHCLSRYRLRVFVAEGIRRGEHPCQYKGH
jgi:hypothetical protein